MNRILVFLLLLFQLPMLNIQCSIFDLQSSGVLAKPITYIWDIDKQKAIRLNPNSQDYKSVIQKAESILKEKPVAVTDKEKTISGNKHNYESLATYYWPDPNNPEGRYIAKDGQTNPETKEYDFPRLLQLNKNCTYLSKAFFLSGDTRYHKALCSQLDTWFISSETRMEPNLDYSQFIPRHNGNKGMPGGVLDAYRLVDVIESILLADHVKSIGRKRRKALVRWFDALGRWMVESQNGQKARVMPNNHAIAYNGTLLEIALFTKNKSLQRDAVQCFVQNIDRQIDDSGKMPNELSRNNAFTYSIFNLSHIVEVCSMIKGSGLELPVTSEAKIRKSALYLSSFIGKKESFPYREIGNWDNQEKNLKKVLQQMNQADLQKKD